MWQKIHTFDGGVVHGVHIYGDELQQPEATDTSARHVQERTELPQQLRRHLLESVIAKEFKTDAILQTIHMVKVRRKRNYYSHWKAEVCSNNVTDTTAAAARIRWQWMNKK